MSLLLAAVLLLTRRRRQFSRRSVGFWMRRVDVPVSAWWLWSLSQSNRKQQFDCRAENTRSEFVGKLVICQILLYPYPASGVCLVRQSIACRRAAT